MFSGRKITKKKDVERNQTHNAIEISSIIYFFSAIAICNTEYKPHIFLMNRYSEAVVNSVWQILSVVASSVCEVEFDWNLVLVSVDEGNGTWQYFRWKFITAFVRLYVCVLIVFARFFFFIPIISFLLDLFFIVSFVGKKIVFRGRYRINDFRY